MSSTGPDVTGESLATMIKRGRRHRTRGELDEAVEVFTSAHEQHPARAGPLVQRGAILILQGRYAESLADYEAAGLLGPDYPGLRSYLAELYLYTGRYEEALALSLDGQRDEPDDLMHAINVAHAKLMLGRTPEALAHYRELAARVHDTKMRFGRDLVLDDLDLLRSAGVHVPDEALVREALSGG